MRNLSPNQLLNQFADFIISKNVIFFYLIAYLFFSVLSTFKFYEALSLVKPHLSFFVVRDLLFFVILGTIFIKYADRSYKLVSIFLLLCLTIHCCILREGLDAYTVLGLKNFIPVVFFFSLVSKKKLNFDIDWLKFVKVTILFNLGLQIIHLFLGYGYYALILKSINARNPGMIFYPAAASLFVLTLFLIYLRKSAKLELIWVALFTASTILCASFTGVAGLVFIYLFKIFPRYRITPKVMALAGASLTLVLLVLHLSRSSMGGATYYTETTSVRLQILTKVFLEMSWLPTQFGFYTNAAAQYFSGRSTDSFYAGFFGNLGIIWSALFIALFVYSVYKNHSKRLDFLILFLICSFAMNVPETGISMFLMVLFNFEQPEQDAVLEKKSYSKIVTSNRPSYEL
ncbi:MAG: hypothetical protein H7328_01765 [Bdellovibrio sp.]|nr:hypothetical protein [Bdellovibrio sp.]